MLLCRSGARSRAAAIALTRSGLLPKRLISRAGLKAMPIKDGHRGNSNGWKAGRSSLAPRIRPQKTN